MLADERRKIAAHCPDKYWTTEAKTVLDWHVANLEFANATTIDTLSLEHWDQDDVHEFLGAHMTCKDGFSAVPRALASGLNVQLSCPVTAIEHSKTGVVVRFDDRRTVAAASSAESAESAGKGEDGLSAAIDGKPDFVTADAVVCTLPLGVLKEVRTVSVPWDVLQSFPS